MSSSRARPAEEQSTYLREAARILLQSLRETEFALAGAGAIREHGIIDRQTKDVDLFTPLVDPDEFSNAVEQGVSALRKHGYAVHEAKRADLFARLKVEHPEGLEFDVDLAVDWRELPPVTLEVGPVLALRDVIGSKICALYGRIAPRDFLDVDAIRSAGIFSDPELIEIAAEHDTGFDSRMFAEQLHGVRNLTEKDVSEYNVTETQLERVKDRLSGWAQTILLSEPTR